MSLKIANAFPSLYGRGNIKVARTGSQSSILIAALNRPSVRNAISDDLYLDLIDVMVDVANDDSLACLILTGIGPYFSSGADLKSGSMISEDGSERDTLCLPAGKFMMTLIEFPKILAAAVNGPAIGIGVTLLLHCDLCFCSESTTIWAPFTRLALVPELCSSTTFLETMGLSKSNELLLLGKKIDANTALQWNICSRVVKSEVLDPFHTDSLANYMATEVDKSLLQLPLGSKTARIFVDLVRRNRKDRLKEICRKELEHLDTRFNNGDVLAAIMNLKDFKNNNGHRSKL